MELNNSFSYESFKLLSKKIFTCLMIFFSFTIVIPKVWSYSNADLWKIIKHASKNNKFPDAAAVILLDEMKSKFKPNGANVSIHEFMVKIQKEKAAPEYSCLRFDFMERTSNVFIEEVKILRADGKIVDEQPLKAVKTLMAPDPGLIFWNFKMKVIPVDKLNKGDVLYYRIRRKGLNLAYLTPENAEERDYLPPMPNNFFDVFYFDNDKPTLKREYFLDAPKEKPIQYQVVNGEVTPSIKFAGKRIHYKWSKENIAAFVHEDSASSFNDTATKLVMATNPNWLGKSRWAFNVNEAQFVISKEMQDKVDELTSGMKTDKEKMTVLLHWVAENIRYLGLDMGPGEGYTVHRTDKIFRERAGVCKDKAACLIAMLRASGIYANFVLTLAQEQAVDIPADQFNHGVVAVPQKDGSFIYLDPTWAPKDRALFNKTEQEQPILISTKRGEDLKHIPYSPPKENFWRISAHTKLSEDGSISSHLTATGDNFSGGHMRQSITYRFPQNRKNYFFLIVNPISPRAEISKIKYRDPLDFSKPMELSIDYKVKDYTLQTKKTIWMVPPLSHFPFSRRWEAWFLYTVGPDKRTKPLELSCTRLMTFDEIITLPKHYKLKKFPEEIKMDSPAADFNYRVEEKKKKLHIFAEIKIKKRVVPPEDYTKFRKIVKKIKEIQKKKLLLVKN